MATMRSSRVSRAIHTLPKLPTPNSRNNSKWAICRRSTARGSTPADAFALGSNRKVSVSSARTRLNVLPQCGHLIVSRAAVSPSSIKLAQWGQRVRIGAFPYVAGYWITRPLCEASSRPTSFCRSHAADARLATARPRRDERNSEDSLESTALRHRFGDAVGEPR